MKRMLGVVAGLTIAATVAANPAQAQEMANTRSVTFGVAGGLSLPLGDFADGYSAGYAVQGSLGFRPAAVPFGLRADVMYQSFDGDGFDGSSNNLSGTLNGLFELAGGGTGLQPYLIGGLGVYRFGGDVAGVDFESQTKLGLNAGAGLRFALSGFNTFLESRFHTVFTNNDNTNFLPIVFGVQF